MNFYQKNVYINTNLALKVNNLHCHYCNKTNTNPVHFIFDCPLLAEEREKYKFYFLNENAMNKLSEVLDYPDKSHLKCFYKLVESIKQKMDTLF